MNAGTTVRFSPTFLTYLIERAALMGKPHVEALHTHQANGMTVQGSPRPGRVNVKFERDGYTQYRTFAARDLIAA